MTLLTLKILQKVLFRKTVYSQKMKLKWKKNDMNWIKRFWRYIENCNTVELTTNKIIGRQKLICIKIITSNIFQKISTLPLQKLWWNEITNSRKYLGIITIFMALNGFVKPCWRKLFLWTNHSRGRFPLAPNKFWTDITKKLLLDRRYYELL